MNIEKKEGQVKGRPMLISTRHRDFPPDPFDPTEPRLGRRESEPHSEEITYIHDVLTTNFPKSRVVWDLHHYFFSNEFGKEIDIQFDISFFKDWSFDRTLSSYKSSDFGNRIPDFAINILSKSTWRADLLDHETTCEHFQIPVYIVFAPYDVASVFYKPPFMRIYYLKEGTYYHLDIREIALKAGSTSVNKEAIVDLGETLKIRLGIMEREKLHHDGRKLYRLVFFDKIEDQMLKTSLELERERSNKLEERAEKEKERADKLEARLEKEKERAEKEREKANKLEKLLEKYKERFGDL
ncbi:MAG: hypothetical protein ACTSXP_14195 [Promethearchaeota archaeon]